MESSSEAEQFTDEVIAAFNDAIRDTEAALSIDDGGDYEEDFEEEDAETNDSFGIDSGMLDELVGLFDDIIAREGGEEDEETEESDDEDEFPFNKKKKKPIKESRQYHLRGRSPLSGKKYRKW